MAEVLICLVIGGTIGWFIRRRTERRVVTAIEDRLSEQYSEEWLDHIKANVKSQEGSIVMVAPGAMVARSELRET